MKTYNEFRAVYKADMEKINTITTPEGLSKAWKDYKNGKYKSEKAPAEPKKAPLPEVIKKMNTELTAANKKVFELRQQKHDGKDVTVELKEKLKFLTDTRIKKKAKMEELGL